MTRLAPVLAVATATLLLAAPALAADYPSNSFDAGDNGGGFRGGFSETGWANSDENDPLSFETGVRYWYSFGSQKWDIGTGAAIANNSTAQSGEVYARVDDASTSSYAKAMLGTSFDITGPGVSSGSVTYGGGDFGFSWWKGKNYSLGPFAGYMYWNDSPNTGTFNYMDPSKPVTFDKDNGQTSFSENSVPNNITTNMLRLGMSGKMDLNSFIDFSGEVAVIPYAKMDGVLGTNSGAPTGAAVQYDNPNSTITGPHGPTGAFNIHDIQSSPTTVDGWGYGAAAEAFVGIHPMQNWTLRLGGRAWYLQGKDDATFSRTSIGDPTDSNKPVDGTPGSAGPPVVAPTPDQPNSPNFDTGPTVSTTNYINRGNPWSLFRYGLLAELTFQF
jgi:hypothetical protein